MYCCVAKFLSPDFCIKNTVLLWVRSEEGDSKQMALACFTEKKNLEVEKNLRTDSVMVKQNDSIKILA